MKRFVVMITMLISSAALADKCKISSMVNSDGSRCESYVTTFEVSNKEECKSIAQSTRQNKFFGILEGKEQVLKTTYKYKKTSPGYKEKIKETIHFINQEDILDICMY